MNSTEHLTCCFSTFNLNLSKSVSCALLLRMAIFLAQDVFSHLARMPASSKRLRTCFSRAEGDILRVKSVSQSLLKLMAWRRTPVQGPSTKAFVDDKYFQFALYYIYTHTQAGAYRSLVNNIHYDAKLSLVAPFSNKSHPTDLHKPFKNLRGRTERMATCTPCAVSVKPDAVLTILNPVSPRVREFSWVTITRGRKSSCARAKLDLHVLALCSAPDPASYFCHTEFGDGIRMRSKLSTEFVVHQKMLGMISVC